MATPATGDEIQVVMHAPKTRPRFRRQSLEARNDSEFLEREKGLEPSTSTLARWHSTTELLPQLKRDTG